jgi:hypothetical protein
MNELTSLSDDLNVITAEINSYKTIAGQSIFEIGRRLKHVKENDLAHGEWGKWCESIGISRSQATKFITVYQEIGGNDSTWNHLGTQALYLIATIPEEDREKTHTIPSTGEQKTVDEMTVRELREIKKALKQAEEDKKRLATLLTEERNKPQQVIEKEVVKEVIPDHIQQEIDDSKRKLSWAKREIERLTAEQQTHKLQNDDFDEAEAERINKKLRFEAEKNVLEMKIHVDSFLKNVSINAFRKGAIAAADDVTRKKLKDSVESLKVFIDEMDLALSGRIEIGRN